MSPSTLLALFFYLELATAIAMLTVGLPRRRLTVSRAVLCLLLAFAIYATLWASSHADLSDSMAQSLLALAAFSSVLGIAALEITCLFDVSLWSALFCATAGYAIQNLASGAHELALAFLGPQAIPFHLLSSSPYSFTRSAIYCLPVRLIIARFRQLVTVRSLQCLSLCP